MLIVTLAPLALPALALATLAAVVLLVPVLVGVVIAALPGQGGLGWVSASG